jgi:hypothetical protein
MHSIESHLTWGSEGITREIQNIGSPENSNAPGGTGSLNEVRWLIEWSGDGMEKVIRQRRHVDHIRGWSYMET